MACEAEAGAEGGEKQHVRTMMHTGGGWWVVVPVYFFPASMASPFLHATILILGAETISFDSILNVGFLTINVHTSSQRRYVCR